MDRVRCMAMCLVGGGTFAAALASGTAPVGANLEAEENELKRIFAGVSSSFALPVADLLVAKQETGWRNMIDGLRGSLTAGVPVDLSQTVSETDGGVVSRTGKTPSLRATFTYNPVSYWFASTTLVGYADYELREAWNPDFTYVFGYDDWHPYTISAYYSNYGGNRLFPNRDEVFSEFLFGTITIAWKFPIPKAIAEPLLIDKSAGIGCAVGYNGSPRYFDLASASNKYWKQSVSLGCKYSVVGNWYFNWSLYAYLNPDQQQPWDPDFTYGFGYFDWRPGTISIQYNNYSGNRFPWRRKNPGTGRFKHGEFSLSWSWAV